MVRGALSALLNLETDIEVLGAAAGAKLPGANCKDFKPTTCWSPTSRDAGPDRLNPRSASSATNCRRKW